MKDQTFVDILDLAHSDLKALDPHVVGVMLVAIIKTDNDEMAVRVGGNVAPEIMQTALLILHDAEFHKL